MLSALGYAQSGHTGCPMLPRPSFRQTGRIRRPTRRLLRNRRCRGVRNGYTIPAWQSFLTEDSSRRSPCRSTRRAETAGGHNSRHNRIPARQLRQFLFERWSCVRTSSRAATDCTATAITEPRLAVMRATRCLPACCSKCAMLEHHWLCGNSGRSRDTARLRFLCRGIRSCGRIAAGPRVCNRLKTEYGGGQGTLVSGRTACDRCPT